jgi:transcriptional regulator of met regulon
MFKYYDGRLKERINKVAEVKQVLKEDIETKKEISMLRKADQEENYMRGQNIHNIYKQKLIEKIVEKKDRADKIKEQQRRIADLCRSVPRPPPTIVN